MEGAFDGNQKVVTQLNITHSKNGQSNMYQQCITQIAGNAIYKNCNDLLLQQIIRTTESNVYSDKKYLKQ
jgi:hypothetical protein